MNSARTKWLFGKQIGVVMLAAVSVGIVASAEGRQCVVTERQKLTASDASGLAYFGSSVALDGNVAVVGAHFEGGAGFWAGAAYVFRHNGTQWVEEQKLTGGDTEAFDFFGAAVAVENDVIVVGAPGDGGETGSAYVFGYNGTTWMEEQKLTLSETSLGFGAPLSLDGNVLLVGEPADDDACPSVFLCRSGAAHVYRYNGAAWAHEQKLTASDAEEDDTFGASLDVCGDVAIIGARKEDNVRIDQGAAYVFRYDGVAWTEEQKLEASDGASLDFFGKAVGICSDRAVVGAYRDIHSGILSGSVYQFDFDGTTWLETQKLVPGDAADDDQFGVSLWLEGDSLLVGSFGDGEFFARAGAAYVYRHDGVTWGDEHKLVATDAGAGDRLGGAVAMSGEAVLTGATGDADAGQDTGSAYVFNVPSVLTDLSLNAQPKFAGVGDTMTFTTCGGVPGNPAMLFVVEVGGVPTIRRIPILGILDAQGMWVLSGTVVSSPLIDVTFRSFALGVGGATIEQSNDQQVLFQ